MLGSKYKPTTYLKALMKKSVAHIKTMELREHAIVISSYLLLTIILTFPVVFKIRTHIPGGIDAFGWIRILWCTSRSILEPNVTTLTHDNLTFYPYGKDIMSFSSAFNQLISFVFFHYVDISIIYTFLWLISFFLGAYGTYMLVNYLTKDKIASFISGIVFAFCPYHMLHALAGHLGATTIIWIPFSALYLMKVYKEPSMKNSILAGIFFILVAMSDLQYMVFMGIFAFLLFFYELYCIIQGARGLYRLEIINLLKKYLVFSLIALAGLIPLTFNDIITATSSQNFLKPSPFEAVTFSTDLLSFFLPSVLHPIMGNFVRPIYSNFTGNVYENTTYIGYTVLLLTILTLFKLRTNKVVKFWQLSALFFTLLSLGPVLHINGMLDFTAYHLTIPLPYQVINQVVPFLENSRTSGRFFVLAALSFSVLAGYGIRELLKVNENRRVLLAAIITGLIIFEYLSIPYPVSCADHPEFYTEISKDNAQYALVEIPATKLYHAWEKIVYYQTIHGKPIVGGQAARLRPNARDFELNTPLIHEITYLQPRGDILNQNLTQIGTSILNFYNIKYIIIHTDYMSLDFLPKNYDYFTGYNPDYFISSQQFRFVDNLLRSTLKVDPQIYENDSMIVYEVPKLPINPFMTLKSGFYEPENWSGTPTRWMGNEADIFVYSDTNRTANLVFRALSFNSTKILDVYKGNMQSKILVPASFMTVSIPIFLTKGSNLISFRVPEGCEKPCNNPKFKNNDSRCLSIAFQDVKIT